MKTKVSIVLFIAFIAFDTLFYRVTNSQKWLFILISAEIISWFTIMFVIGGSELSENTKRIFKKSKYEKDI